MKQAYLKIKKGFFYGAGSNKVYNWQKDGFHIYGVGIDVDLLNKYDELIVEVEGDIYSLDTTMALEFAKSYDSYQMKRGTRLAVISKTLLMNQIDEY